MVNESGHGCVSRPGVKIRLIEERTVHETHMTVMAMVRRTTVHVLLDIHVRDHDRDRDHGRDQIDG